MALSEVNRGRIIGMWEAGLSSEDIAQSIPCTPQSEVDFSIPNRRRSWSHRQTKK